MVFFITQNSELKTPNSAQSAAGFTLLEVMIAMTILAIALVALSRAQSQSLGVTGVSRQETTLCLLAQSRMAEVESGQVLAASSQKGDFGADYADFAWETRISDSGIRNLRKIEVTVRDKRSSKEEPFRLVMYKYSLQ